MVPGDSVSRPYTVVNSGSLPFTYALTTSCADPCGPLWNDAADGLKLTVARGNAMIYRGPMDVANTPMGVTLTPGQSDQLAFTVALPASAGNVMAALSATITFSFTAIQS
jgi:hypothetical protein